MLRLEFIMRFKNLACCDLTKAVSGKKPPSIKHKSLPVEDLMPKSNLMADMYALFKTLELAPS